MLTTGNLIIQLLPLVTFLIPIFIIIYVIRIVRRMEHRAEERLQLDKRNTDLQQQQMESITELNGRLKKIENTLKEVE